MAIHRWGAALAALALVAVGAHSRRADDTPPAPAASKMDAAVFKQLRTVINRGAALYNSGDYAGCYRLYEGSLMTLEPVLDQHPDLQKLITTRLKQAERDPVIWRRAFTLRAALDKVRGELNPKAKKKVEEKDKPEDKKDEPKDEEEKSPKEKKADEKKPDAPEGDEEVQIAPPPRKVNSDD